MSKVGTANSFKEWLIWSLRKASYRWPARTEAMRDARVERGRYRCASCKEIFPNRQISLDHIVPVVDPAWGKWTSWKEHIVEYIERLFVDRRGWQVLCSTCHDHKTEQEREQKKNLRKRVTTRYRR